MKRRKAGIEEKSAIELIEEATNLLRQLDKDAYLSYYIGSLAFVLTFLFFWADMSRGAFAETHVTAAALSVGIAYVWMKCWQAVFSSRLESYLMGAPPTKWTFRRILRLMTVQISVQPTSLIALPLASVIALPFAWTYAFYQNLSVFGNGESAEIKKTCETAWRQAGVAVAQNHIVIMIYSLFVVVVFINLAVILYALPNLFTIISGVETSFSRMSWRILNTTFFAVVMSGTYLIVNPLAKAIYVLRCYYGGSRKTGADLKADLARCSAATKYQAAAAALLFLCILCAPADSSLATLPSQQTTQKAVSAPQLDRAIGEVISRPEYAWRLPREKAARKDDHSVIGKFISSAAEMLSKWIKTAYGWLKKAVKWSVDRLSGIMKPHKDTAAADGRWMGAVRNVLLAILGVAVLILAFVLWRVFRHYHFHPPTVTALNAERKPDIVREDTQADELPADGWLKVANEFIEQGDLRSALRALYLASLSHLARQKMIVIARFKSNKEYENELYRRAHDAPELLAAFARNVRIYESAWYGMHEVTRDHFNRFQENQARITAIADTL